MSTVCWVSELNMHGASEMLSLLHSATECCHLPAGPDKKLKLSLNYPASVGRNMDEIVRCVDALQLSAKYSVATPANCEFLLCCACMGSSLYPVPAHRATPPLRA